MAVAFIQGASRGIGLEFARALSARGNVNVIAGCRDPDSALGLQTLKKVTIVRCDVCKEEDRLILVGVLTSGLRGMPKSFATVSVGTLPAPM